MKKENKCPFRYGQRVRLKNEKRKGRYGIVVSRGFAQIGDPYTCRIPGGPLVFEDYVFITWTINGKKYLCMDLISNLEPYSESSASMRS